MKKISMNNFAQCTHHTSTYTHECYKINLIYRTTHFLFGPRESGTQYDIRASEAEQKQIKEEEEDAKNWKRRPESERKKYRQIIFKVLFIFSIRLFSLCARRKWTKSTSRIYNNNYWCCHLDNSLRHRIFFSLAVFNRFLFFSSCAISIFCCSFAFLYFSFLLRYTDCFCSMCQWSKNERASARMYTGRFKSQKIVCCRQSIRFFFSLVPISIQFIENQIKALWTRWLKMLTNTVGVCVRCCRLRVPSRSMLVLFFFIWEQSHAV